MTTRPLRCSVLLGAALMGGAAIVVGSAACGVFGSRNSLNSGSNVGSPLVSATPAGGSSSTASQDSTSAVAALPLAAVGSGGIRGDATTAQGIRFAKSHPRLWFGDSTRYERAKAFAQTHAHLAPSDKVGDYREAIDLAFMHVAGNVDCAAAIQWALNFQNKSGSAPKPSDAGSDKVRWGGEAIVLVYDWCYDQLTASQRSTLIDAWNIWFGNVKQQAWGGVGMYEDNYFWGNLRNEMEWGIATLGENAQADTFLSHALNVRWKGAVEYFRKGGEGGVCAEGMDYGGTVLYYPLIPFVTAQAGGRNLFAETDRFFSAVYWLLYAGLPAKTYNVGTKQMDWQWFPFNDDEHAFWDGDRQRAHYYGDFMSQAVRIWPSTAGRYAQAWLNRVSPKQSLFTEADAVKVAAANLSELPLDFYGSGISYLYGRSKKLDSKDTNPGTVFLWQLGRPPQGSTGHRHYDSGSFQMWRNGRWLTREATAYATPVPGYKNGPGEDGGHGIAHNMPLVNGLGPVAWRFRERGMPVVRRLESQPAYSYASVQLTESYQIHPDHQELENRALVSLEREYLFVRSLETMLVLDRIQMQSPDKGATPATSVGATFVLHFETTPSVEDSNHLLAVNGDQALRVTTLIPTAGGTYRQIPEPKSFAVRTELDYVGGASSACGPNRSCVYLLNVLQARNASAPNLKAAVVDSTPTNPTTGTFTVTLRPNTGADVTIVLQKGMQSAAGSIDIAGARRPLRADVQHVSYTENGPVWN